MVAEVADLDVIVVDTEMEALILESNVVKRERPRYNVLLRDDKQFPYLRLSVRPHPFFTRDEADLFVDVPVSLPELVQGATVEVPTADGSVQMKIPPRSPNGRKLRLRGQGGAQRGSSERGDLYARLLLVLPETDDPRLDELASEMEALYEGQDVRQGLKR